MRLILLFLLYIGYALINGPLYVFSESQLKEENEKSLLRPAVERIFSRKKRWMIFPKGSSLKFTANISKRLLAMYPKGFNFALEAAIYYPMPTARIDLIPKRFRKPTSKKPVTKVPTPPYLIGIPGSLIKYRAKPAIKPAKVQRIDENVSSLHWLPSPSFNFHQNNSQKWSKYSSPQYSKNYQWSLEKQQKYMNKYSKYNRKWQPTHANQRNIYHKWYHRSRYSRDIEQFHDYKPIYFEELEPFEDSPHYYSHRTRRELFHHFEGFSKILGIDMKSCILRAVCDSKRYLLPPGYSMIQDILRVIFTFPTISGLKDDYSRIMEADYHTCDYQIRNKCSFNILDWLLNSNKTL